MPYTNEVASKAGHQSLASNPGVARFLSECSYLAPLTETKAKKLAKCFQPIQAIEQPSVDKVFAIDGSRCEVALHENIPNTSIGFVQVNHVEFSLAQHRKLAAAKVIDPFAFSSLETKTESFQFCAPGANVLWKDHPSLRTSFRAAFDAFLRDKDLITTLFQLASERPGPLRTGNPSLLLLHRCPNHGDDNERLGAKCEAKRIEVHDFVSPQFCPGCKEPIYASDVLRIFEEVNEQGSIECALTRTSLTIEHLSLVRSIHSRDFFNRSKLEDTAYFVDGPLAIFGPPCSFYAPIQSYLHELRARTPSLLVIGIQKSGQLVEHARQLIPWLVPGTLLPVSDDYRYSHVILSRDAAEETYGRQAYYGQDFIYFSKKRKLFVFGLPYCVPGKCGRFATEKSKPEHYPQLPEVCGLLEELSTDLYENALAPTVMAHASASISLNPGAGLLRQLGVQHFAGGL